MRTENLKPVSEPAALAVETGCCQVLSRSVNTALQSSSSDDEQPFSAATCRCI